MYINVIKMDGMNIAEIQSDDVEIKDVRDALDLMANCDFRGAWKIIIDEKNIDPEFFSLKSGIAGQIIQKFVNYKVNLAIVGDFSKYPGESFKAFVYECNKTKQVVFADTVHEAIRLLSA